MVVYSSQVSAREGELRLNSAASAAVGVGFEISHGDYGTGADATVVTLPLSVFFYPVDKLDVDIEVPFLYLSGKSGSGVVVTRSGGAGRGRAAAVRSRRHPERQRSRIRHRGYKHDRRLDTLAGGDGRPRSVPRSM